MVAFAHSFRMVLFGIAALALTGAAMAAPVRIVSTSLCGDAYVLALAEPQNIRALSWQANTKLSAAPPSLRQKNLGQASAERLARLDPDIIVMGPGDAPRAARAAQKGGAEVFVLNWVEDFSGVYANLEALGIALHQENKAHARIQAIKSRLATLQGHKSRKPVRVLYLTPTSSSAGAGVFVDRAIRAAGGINHGITLGIKGWGRVPLEKLALNPPDLIITSFFREGYASVADMRQRHPLLQRVLKTVPTVSIDAKNWICAGPRLINAVEDIAAALDTSTKKNGS